MGESLADSRDSSTPIPTVKKTTLSPHRGYFHKRALHTLVQFNPFQWTLSKQTRKPPLVIMSSFVWFRTKDLRPEAKNFEVFFVHTVSHSFRFLGWRWPCKLNFIWLRRIFFPVLSPSLVKCDSLLEKVTSQWGSEVYMGDILFDLPSWIPFSPLFVLSQNVFITWRITLDMPWNGWRR